MTNKLIGRRGMTLIEMTVVIVLIGLIVPPLLEMFADVCEKSAMAELMFRGNSFARSLLEEISCKKYDENSASPWSNPLGTDTGESTRDDYDDVDDFDGFSESSVSDFPGFTRSVTVYYVDPDSSNLDTAQPDSSNTLDYKRIDVTASHSLSGNIRASTVVSRSHLKQ